MSSLQTINHFDTFLSNISKIQFFAEYSLNGYIGKDFGETGMLQLLSFFEILKLYYRLKKFVYSQKRIFISEETSLSSLATKNIKGEKDANIKDNSDSKESSKVERLFFKNNDEEIDPNNLPYTNEVLKTKIKKALESLKSNNQESHNEYFNEKLKRTEIKVNALSSLPIPRSFQKIPYSLKIILGEVVFLIRPFIYNIFKISFGENSYRPYIISLLIDMILIIIQNNTKIINLEEYNEMKHRNSERFWKYLWRNPIYHIWKNRILIPLLDKLFPKLQFIKKIIIYIVEIRSSSSFLM